MNTTFIFIIYSVLIISLIAIAVFTDKRYYIITKTVCSLAFLGIGLSLARIIPDGTDASCNPILSADPYRLRFAFTGLVLCALGDIFMGQYNRYRKKNYMASGMLTFLLAHMAFIAYVYHISPQVPVFAILFPIACCLLFLFFCKRFHLHLGKLKGFAAVYCFFVSSFMGKSVCILIDGLARKSSLSISLQSAIHLGIAATLFWISDFTLIFLYFFHYRSKKAEKITHAVNLATYYIAMGLLAIPLFMN